MPACEAKFVSRSSRKATVAKTIFAGYRPSSRSRMPSLVDDVLGAWSAGLVFNWITQFSTVGAAIL